MTVPSRKPYIAGNWKMNLDRSKSLDLIKTVKGRIGDGNDREVAVFVPAIYLADVGAGHAIRGTTPRNPLNFARNSELKGENPP